jgi:hypothetical protein
MDKLAIWAALLSGGVQELLHRPEPTSRKRDLFGNIGYRIAPLSELADNPTFRGTPV